MSPDVAASVRARLLNRARQSGEQFEITLVRFAAERFLYRLGASAHRERCVVKGAVLLTLWMDEPDRASRDIDLLAMGPDDAAAVRDIMTTVAAVPCPEDGLIFDATRIQISPIREAEMYHGQRAVMWARLGQARIRVQVDFGFGDIVATGAVESEYPTMLATLPPPRVRTYPREQSVAEKFEAMVKLGRRNSRMKDFHDIWSLSSVFTFSGRILATAVEACFTRRGTPWTDEVPDVLTPGFYEDPALQDLWASYVRSNEVRIPPPADFAVVGERVVTFLGPLRAAATAREPFARVWRPGGPWEAIA